MEDELEYISAESEDERVGDDMNLLKRKGWRSYKNMNIPFFPIPEELYVPNKWGKVTATMDD